MPKAQKRQRKKEHRQAKIEEELRRQKAARRRQMTILLFGLILLAAGGVSLFLANRSRDTTRTASPTPSSTLPPGCPVTSEPPLTIDPATTYRATMETSLGTIVIDLAADRAPKTVNSFVALARCGFYDGLTFHRIVKDFAIQGGDPEGDGSGGPPYKVTEAPPEGIRYTRGTVAMAKGGAEPAGTSGSQFFIVPDDSAAARLTPDYALLGTVSSGLDTVDALEAVETTASPSNPTETSRPVDPPRIVRVTIVEPAGAPSPASPTAPAGSPPAGASPSPTASPAS